MESTPVNSLGPTPLEQPIIVRYRWTADEMLRAQRYQFRLIFKPAYRFIFYIVVLAALVAAIAGGSRNEGYSGPCLTFFCMGIYLIGIHPFIRRWIIRYRFAKRSDKDIELEWQFSSDRILRRSDLAQGEINWKAYDKMVQTPAGAMLYSSGPVFHWLPRHGFANDADYLKFIDLAKSRIARHREVK